MLANSLENGFGGTTSFAYQFEAVGQFQDYEGVPPGILFNGRAVVATSRTVAPGFGAVNQTTNYSNYTIPLGNNDANWPDFLGHSQVTVTDAASNATNSYLQGQSPGRLTQQTVRDLASPPNTVHSTTNTWTATHLDPNASGITWTALSQSDVTQQSGQKRTSYQYATASQNGGQYGNRTDTFEYDLTQSGTIWLRHSNRQFFPEVTDATGQSRTSRVYDSVGRLSSQADPDLGSWTYQYNPIGTLASRTDAKSQTISYSYDNLDRLSGKNGTGLSVTYSYDSGPNGIGRRSQMTDSTGTASYGYDARGRLILFTRAINGASYPLATTYDEQDRVLTLTYPNGDLLSYIYADNSAPQSLVLNGNIILVNDATYTQLNQLAALPWGNGLTTQYHYYALDASPPQPNQWFGRLAQVVTGSVQNETISSYDGVGNPTGVNYGAHIGEGFTASYNEWDQLTSYGSLEGYGYIPGGQQYDIGTLQTKGGESYAYPAPGQPRPHAPTSVSGVGSLSYDANGNRSGDSTTTYAYDIEDHLTQLTQGGTTVLQNAFGGDGVRLVRTAGGVTTHYVGDWYEANVTGGVATAYNPFNGEAVAMKVGSTLSFLHRLHLASLVSATDGSGNELAWARYFPFGALRLSGGTLPSDRLFTGQIRDLGDDRRYWFKPGRMTRPSARHALSTMQATQGD